MVFGWGDCDGWQLAHELAGDAGAGEILTFGRHGRGQQELPRDTVYRHSRIGQVWQTDDNNGRRFGVTMALYTLQLH